MLSGEDNDLICRVGPGTPMGQLMREYWLPAMLSAELPRADCDPVRVVLLGERLVGFRDSEGVVALIQNLCPHRGASLFLGRNEKCGLRCVYHGWKFDRTGACVDMPNEPPESNFRQHIHATAYPCMERGGIVWTYMGSREAPPPLPEIPGNMLADSDAHVTAISKEYNWLQGLEGDFDTTHAGFLHWGALEAENYPEGSVMHYSLKSRHAKFSSMDTDYGLLYGAVRPAQAGREFWRLTQFLFPFHTNTGGFQNKAYVPMDDYHTLVIRTDLASRAHGHVDVLPNGTGWYERFVPVANSSNDYLIDRELQRSGKSFTGIASGIPIEDQAVCETMGPLLDREGEHLGSADAVVISLRQRLLQAARGLRDGKEPAPGADQPSAYNVTPAGHIILPEGATLADAAAGLLATSPSERDRPTVL